MWLNILLVTLNQEHWNLTEIKQRIVIIIKSSTHHILTGQQPDDELSSYWCLGGTNIHIKNW